VWDWNSARGFCGKEITFQLGLRRQEKERDLGGSGNFEGKSIGIGKEETAETSSNETETSLISTMKKEEEAKPSRTRRWAGKGKKEAESSPLQRGQNVLMHGEKVC